MVLTGGYKPDFEAQLIRSHSVTQIVAGWFRSIGMCATVRPLKITPSWNKRGEYFDDGWDLFVEGRFFDVKTRFEKGNGRWNSLGNFPFSHSIVCRTREITRMEKKKLPLPYGWIITNWLAEADDFEVTGEKVTNGHVALLSSRDVWVEMHGAYWGCPLWRLAPIWSLRSGVIDDKPVVAEGDVKL